MISCQMSLYPIGAANYNEIIKEAITVLDRAGVTYRVGSMSTVVEGDDDAVWQAVRSLFEAGAGRGLVVLVATFSNACPVDPR